MTASNKITAAAKNPGKVFLSVEDIADRFTDYQVFDVRFNLSQADHGRSEYEKAHIPRATFVDMDLELSGEICPANGRHPLPDADLFILWCQSKSISGDKPVLCYDDECGGMGGCRLWWMLHSLGVEAYVLNGGFQLYRAAGLPIETGPLKEKPLASNLWPFAKKFGRSLAVDEIPCNAVLVDARAADRFGSTVRPYGCDALPGHIENALNMPWTVNVVSAGAGKILRPEDECRSNVLKTLSGAWGNGTPDVSKCVFYCGSGVTATFNIALVCHLGLGEPFLYCGAWSQYQTLYAVSIARHTVNTYGMLFKMMSPILGGNQKATIENAMLTVDGAAAVSSSSSPDAEIQEAVQHMHLWEKAQVFFKSGRIAVIEVAPRR